MASDDLHRIEEKLDLLIAIQRAAHGAELDALTEELRDDSVAAAVLRAAKKWQAAGDLKRAVRTRAQASPATIDRRLADLVARGLLHRRGSGPAVEYRSSGLVEL